MNIDYAKLGIDDIQKLNLPYVSFDIISGVIVNGTIKRIKSKRANKSN